MSTKVAVVTGSNKGIGFETVRALCKVFKGDVYLTARDEERGKQAVKDLENENLHPKFHQLDITSKESIGKIRNFLEKNYGGLDILVNNAGIAYKKGSTAPLSEQAEVSVQCNFFGTLAVCHALFPLLRPHSRVVNVATRGGSITCSKLSQELCAQFKSPSLTESDVIKLMNQFVSDVKAGNHQEKGWCDMAYGTSKLGVIALTHAQAREIDSDPREDVLINVCCPGLVKTDMSSNNPNYIPPDEAAETQVYLALLPPNVGQPHGEFLAEKKVIPWRTEAAGLHF